jgi:hypothetical protein
MGIKKGEVSKCCAGVEDLEYDLEIMHLKPYENGFNLERWELVCSVVYHFAHH